jgi:hypothetical protein
MSGEQLEVILSERDKPMVRRGGYLYGYTKDGLQKKNWRCDHYYKTKCSARIHTSEDSKNPILLAEFGEHNHEPDPLRCDVKVVLKKIQQVACTSKESTSKIVSSEVQGVLNATQGQLPLIENLKRNVRRARVRSTGERFLINPLSREDINLPHEFTMTDNDKLFLMYDSGRHADRILMFTTTENLEFLKNSSMWFVDGTFKVAPVLFTQLFVVHGMRGKTVFPLVYVLTPRKDTATYSRIFKELLKLESGLAPEVIMSDFELASLNAFKDVFPAAEQKGCFFHFAQAFHRQIQQHSEIFQLYNENADFRLQLRFLVALAFIPPDDVIVTFGLILETEFFMLHEEKLTPLVKYFETTWLGCMNRREDGRIPPRFPIELWNCYYSVLEDLPKTNNACEGFHNGFAILLGASHPTIYKLITGLKQQQTLTELKMNQFLALKEQAPDKKYVNAAAVLKKHVQRYGEGEFSHMEYLKGICNRQKKYILFLIEFHNQWVMCLCSFHNTWCMSV